MVYSIDEVFMDVTDYLNTYKLSAHDLAMKIILDVLETTGIKMCIRDSVKEICQTTT